MACARNDKLFSDGSDLAQLAKEIRYVVGGSEEVAKTFRVIALPKSWMTDPWSQLEESEHPDRWDERLPILVVPEEVDKISARPWPLGKGPTSKAAQHCSVLIAANRIVPSLL